MDKQIVKAVKKKREFSQLPDSVVLRAIEKSGGDVKNARALLRKYFGVFLTNKILKARDIGVLKSHISTKNRNYESLYKKIIANERTIIDLGCGVNGFSYKCFPDDLSYVGVEAVGQLVDLTNNYFREGGFEKAHVFHGDLFDISFILDILKKLETEKPRVVFMFNTIDALEFFERDFSKNFILAISGESEKIVLSFPTKSLSGKTRFKVKRGWILGFLKENFNILDDFELNDERFIIFKNTNS